MRSSARDDSAKWDCDLFGTALEVDDDTSLGTARRAGCREEASRNLREFPVDLNPLTWLQP